MEEPFHLLGNQSLGEIGMQERVERNGNTALVLLGENVIEVVGDHVGYENARLDRSGTAAGWAGFAGNDVHLRPYALTRDLQQAEFRKW